MKIVSYYVDKYGVLFEIIRTDTNVIISCVHKNIVIDQTDYDDLEIERIVEYIKE